MKEFESEEKEQKTGGSARKYSDSHIKIQQKIDQAPVA